MSINFEPVTRYNFFVKNLIFKKNPLLSSDTFFDVLDILDGHDFDVYYNRENDIWLTFDHQQIDKIDHLLFHDGTIGFLCLEDLRKFEDNITFHKSFNQVASRAYYLFFESEVDNSSYDEDCISLEEHYPELHQRLLNYVGSDHYNYCVDFEEVCQLFNHIFNKDDRNKLIGQLIDGVEDLLSSNGIYELGDGDNNAIGKAAYKKLSKHFASILEKRKLLQPEHKNTLNR